MRLKALLFLFLGVAIVASFIVFLVRHRDLQGKLTPKAGIEVEDKAKAIVALVVDDLGYNLKYIEELFSVRYPMTLGVLPKLSYSSWIAKKANEEGFEVILHLPLESHRETARPGPGTISTTMEESQVKRFFSEDLESVPYAKGVSNHMGSKATEDEGLMRVILSQMKKRNLYFLDSLVTPKSICRDLCHRLDIRFTQRDVFLDNEDEPDYIRRQIRTLAKVAFLKGKAVGICHLRSSTILDLLKEMIPKLESEGIRFVYVSELVGLLGTVPNDVTYDKY